MKSELCLFFSLRLTIISYNFHYKNHLQSYQILLPSVAYPNNSNIEKFLWFQVFTDIIRTIVLIAVQHIDQRRVKMY